jgi:hypothetical protein
MADLANIAAATAAGYKEVVTQRGGVFSVILEKTLSGAAGQDILQARAHGEGASQAAAEAVALAGLKHQRDTRGRRGSNTVDAN